MSYTTLVKDIAERAVWTALEAGVAYVGTRLVDVGPEWALAAAPVLAVVKGWIASHIGKRDAALPSPE